MLLERWSQYAYIYNFSQKTTFLLQGVVSLSDYLFFYVVILVYKKFLSMFVELQHKTK